MAFAGFGKHSGPTGAGNSKPSFGNFPRPLSSTSAPSPPSFPNAAPVRSPMPTESPPRLGNSQRNFYKDFDAPTDERPVGSPPRLGNNQNYFYKDYDAPTDQMPAGSPPRLGNSQNYFYKDYDAPTDQRPSAISSFVTSRNSGTSVTAKIARFQDPKRSRSPPLLSRQEDLLRSSSETGNRSPSFPQTTNSPSLAFKTNHSIEVYHPSFGEAQRHQDMLLIGRSELVPEIIRSPPLTNESNRFTKNFHRIGEVQRAAQPSVGLGDRLKVPENHTNSLAHQDLPSVSSYDSGSFQPEIANLPALKRMRSPPLLSENEASEKFEHFAQNAFKRPTISPSGTYFNTPDTQTHQASMPFAHDIDAEAAVTKAKGSLVSKRSRSPPIASTNQVLQGNSYSYQGDSEREMKAKAMRLARFRDELSENVPSSSDITDQKVSANKLDYSMLGKGKHVQEHSKESAADFSNGNILSEYEGMEASSIIIGLCPDMCPESERGERERKGDLDQYERLDGDRNQTSKCLAVKKYTRTAEREANLIRPMPILQKTIDYLLHLLDQPYDDKFLGMYNFLWDRMRAVRMDLRMQHIFTRGSITMLEQMIRLHIIAMHELCEYTKGEGFSEGFDAHLNIEQMNKTSVELFQMYDDHRKKGINVPTEKEFRGYYALLKLDKHPGYKVEPAELSLDLAKMTPEIRQTPEVLFARDVARACRTGNYIAFFRLVRKASYLQACLMHAHFAKLRTQALAALHSGLQSNQGLPVSQVAKWLGLEEEDVESFVEYHGFLIKDFEEPYMVKEGQFLNDDRDYPTKHSKLVQMKKSKKIIRDVLSSFQVVSSTAEAAKEIRSNDINEHGPKVIQSIERGSSIDAVDEEMSNQETSSPKAGIEVQPVLENLVAQHSKEDRQVAGASLPQWNFSLAHTSPVSAPPVSCPAKSRAVGKPNSDFLFSNSPDRILHSGSQGIPLQVVPIISEQDGSPGFQTRHIPQQERSSGFQTKYAREASVAPSVVMNISEHEEPQDIHQESKLAEVVTNDQDKKVAEAKLKLILRLWKRRSLKQRELREQKKLAADAALSSLSLGPPVRQNKNRSSTVGEFDIDHVMRERQENHGKSWSRLNVSDVIADVLCRRNPNAKCLCWKIVMCPQLSTTVKGDAPGQSHQVAHLATGSWLVSKLMPDRKDDDDDDLVISSSGLSIWNKWVPSQSGGDLTCCLSVIKDTRFDNSNEAVSGASAVLFLFSQSIPCELQKVQLHNLLMSLPSGSCLPLLVLSDSYNEGVLDPYYTIISTLGLHNIDKSRVSSFSVVFLIENKQSEHSAGFFSDERLREGLRWLASETRTQPVLYCVKTRELVVSHLNSLLDMLNKKSDFEVRPDCYISAFNEALDQSIGDITGAASANPGGWPCPEISFLDELSEEHSAAKWYLPSIGWSSTARIQPLMLALRDCKLPTFPDDLSWLNGHSIDGKGIERLGIQLENCLIRYLTESSNIMGNALATKEACVMLQKGAHLQLHDSRYYIVPRWVMIFRRIFNWRLMSLSSGIFSEAYVSEQRSIAPPTSDFDRSSSLENGVSPPYYLNSPSLDEMVEVGYNLISSGRDQSQPEALKPVSGTIPKSNEATHTIDLTMEEANFAEDGELAVRDEAAYLASGTENNGDLVLAANATKEADKLSILLEQCNIVQNRLDETLSIYF